MKFTMSLLFVMYIGVEPVFALSAFPVGCGEKPELMPWIVEVAESRQVNGYCYTGEEDGHLGFPCDIKGEIAEPGDQVLGYTDYHCVDIGHVPGYHFGWSPRSVPVQILP